MGTDYSAQIPYSSNCNVILHNIHYAHILDIQVGGGVSKDADNLSSVQ